MNETMGFEEVEHTADWALRICGRDLSELFSRGILYKGAIAVDDHLRRHEHKKDAGRKACTFFRFYYP